MRIPAASSCCWLPSKKLLLSLILAVLVELVAANNRQVAYSVLRPTVDVFEQDGVESYMTILPDIPHYQLIVGARDHLFRLNLEGLRRLEEVYWPSREETIIMCQQKGQPREDCRNFIKVLHAHQGRVFACGTNAFAPECTWRDMNSLNPALERVAGVAKCPYNPHHNSTSILTFQGDYYLAGALDFSSADSAIYRIMGQPPFIRTKQYDPRWLNEPHFVASFEIGNFVYFFFRETAVEYINCGKIIYSRVARVCKNDKGGGDFLLKDNWTTFVKARLNCSIAGSFPFYYNEIQGVHLDEREQIIYATFSTPPNSVYSSAVCAFNLTSIEQAFQGPFKYQLNTKSAWERKEVDYSHAQRCDAAGNSQHFIASELYQLMDDAVQPVSLNPIYTLDLARFHHIAVDVVPTKYHAGVHVIFVSTVEGTIKKLLQAPNTHQTCHIEELHPFPPNASDTRIYTMKLLHDTGSLFIGTKLSLIRIPLHRCSQYLTRSECLKSLDPYCGWNNHQMACTTAPHSNRQSDYWEQTAITCPHSKTPVDGEWSEWSPWTKCDKMNSDGPCLCQYRECNNPPPRNGGLPCEGSAIRISNCTRNGGWTAWSAWSSCSQTCGLAEKSRHRTCTNPTPMFGGATCTGPDREVIYCTSNPACPVYRGGALAVGGEWSDWGSWSDCSVPCGTGFQTRRRHCRAYPGSSGCVGCGEQTQPCNTHSCTEVRKVSAWTPWLITSPPTSALAAGYTEQRFRFTCHANVTDPRFLHVSHFKREERFCQLSGKCSDTDGTSDADWTDCSVSCGGGIQFRQLPCEEPGCVEGAVIARVCNTEPCPGGFYGHWSCWSEFSPCTGQIGATRVRTRSCLPAQAKCEGADTQHAPCDPPTPPCKREEVALSAGTSNSVHLGGGLSVGYIVLIALTTFIFGLVLGLVIPWRINGPHTPLIQLTSRVKSNSNTYVSQHEWITDPSQLSVKKEATIRRNSHPPIRANLDSDSF